ncbi:siderophore-interacting protein [Alcaligenaceae bacterium]|nr:siderophore-interacting protein [Alcaligenaceae bacterium]
MNTASLKVEKLQHPIKVRTLQVKRVTQLSPSMRRITLTGGDLAGFLSASFDDHVKLMVPDVLATKPNVPVVGPTGLIFAQDQPKPAMRDYTPRRYDPAASELDIDFVLHHAGPATEWAKYAEPGHFVGIAGPRGSFLVPTAYDWHLLIGDETAIPAIGRRLEELPAAAKAIVIIKTETDAGRLEFSSRCQLDIQWVSETDSTGAAMGAFESAMRNMTLPSGEGYAWAAGEYSEIKAVRQYLVEGLGLDKDRIRAASYWRKAAASTHERFE